MVLGTVSDTQARVGFYSHVMVERMAAQALNAQDFLAAFKYADRRCRVGPPSAAHCLVLRAEANWRLERKEAALADLAEALLVDPSDLAANRRMLAWANDDRRRTAAASLIGRDSNPTILRVAIEELWRAGDRHWAACSVFDNHVTGWIAWTRANTVAVSLAVENGTLTSVLEPNSFHPLASMEVQATAFLVRRPPSRAPQTLTLTYNGEIIQVRRLAPNLSTPPDIRTEACRSNTPRHDTSEPTVIVPVYRDVQATLDCFVSLIKARASSATGQHPFRILAVDDATPEPELRRYLNELAADGAIDCLVNETNLGFVGAVNRALESVPVGDVVLLNSDTIVPPSFVERLAAVAHSAPDIGTVTPLSNNGDIFSFPTPNDLNPMQGYESILEIDRVASIANAGEVIDVPSGIGFCLYITRDCLAAIGGLSENFERGYLEDVDLCLRARARGFRNVCAPSVYVGHHGSKSFRHEKRSLVLRNLEVLDRRFPGYRRECRAFEIADPLRPARARLDRALTWPSEPSVLILGNRRGFAAVAEERARHLRQRGERAVLLLRERDVVDLRVADGSSPQAVRLSFGSEAAIAEAADIIARLRPGRVEIVEPNPLPRLIELIRKLGLPIHPWLTAGDLGEAVTSLPDETPLLAPGKTAKAFAEARWPNRKIVLQDWPTRPLTLTPIRGASQSLAIVPSAPSPASFRLMRRLAERLQQRGPSRSIVIAGATCDDDRLMSYANVFITGAVAADEIGDVLVPHNPGWLLTDFEEPAFGHPLIETARRASIPVAYRDWSAGSAKPRKGDLAIPADADDQELVDAVLAWVGLS
ncbi:glycosyl transferase, family 2 [Nitrobacter hamburgensis X14]|uniref:Glycosyl transferase, family 2 n=1 Tax=Nitrobacter hamburgensis (strain DSM 10229 / NCIMB 13809 / X14) TaxID=323097 RepID=Q1QPD6_NITHX|nr:glycosyltransferase [Nitrobacter hamburgensis]ABE61911.1 glycosyl transferase, family 2 [Nitrobacter hamburgensis X14]